MEGFAVFMFFIPILLCLCLLSMIYDCRKSLKHVDQSYDLISDNLLILEISADGIFRQKLEASKRSKEKQQDDLKKHRKRRVKFKNISGMKLKVTSG